MREYLEDKFAFVPEWDWKGKLFVKQLESDRKRVEAIEQCDHTPRVYQGRKTCCGKCGAFYQKGMGFTWTLQFDLDRLEKEHVEEMMREVKEATGERD